MSKGRLHGRGEREHAQAKIIDVIFGGDDTLASGKRKAKRTIYEIRQSQGQKRRFDTAQFDSEPLISFHESDSSHVMHPHDDNLVVTIKVNEFDVKRVPIDTGSSTDILFRITHHAYSSCWLHRAIHHPQRYNILPSNLWQRRPAGHS